MGCIPTKALVASAEAIHTARRGDEYGFRITGLEPDWPRAVARKNTIVGQIRGRLEQEYESGQGPRLIRGWAQFESSTCLRVNGRLLETEKIIVATGVAPVIPDLPGLREAGYLTNETVMDLSQLPESMIVIGGGPEGMEFGQMFQRFGTRVTVLQRRDRVLPREDLDVSRELETILREEGLNIRTGATPRRAEGKNGDRVVVHADIAGREERFAATHLLLAAGRRPRHPAELGLDAAGVSADERGGIKVNRALRTAAPNIWAIGDVLGRAQYTHFAVYTADLAVASALDGRDVAVDETRVPGAVFTDPEVASVGLTEQRAQELGRRIKVGTQPFQKVGRARAAGHTKGFVKWIVDADTDEVLGFHVLGHGGADLLPQALIAMHAPGRKIDPVLKCICIHPTFSEGVKAAAENLKPIRHVGPPTATGELPA
ncbi:MAG: FAD-dependent oxidoreductase [Chloroflexi bacterium]|nr:FAD-dependent oxidoreductase [Chloroflexota bacterium]